MTMTNSSSPWPNGKLTSRASPESNPERNIPATSNSYEIRLYSTGTLKLVRMGTSLRRPTTNRPKWWAVEDSSHPTSCSAQRWPRRGSNPHSTFVEPDFKSDASACFATRPRVVVGAGC